MTDDKFPVQQLEQAGYQAVYSGQKTYNGVAILSKLPLQLVSTEIPGLADPQKRVLCAVVGQLCVLNLYVPNGSEVGSDKYRYKLDWLSRLQSYARSMLGKYTHCIVVGDFNIAPADQDVYDPVAWRGQVLCSEPERAHFFSLLDAGLTDCYRQFPQAANSYSWWDYRAGAFRRNHGLRIDHILADAALVAKCSSCHIDKIPRKLEQPSDHAPVVAEFDI